MIQAIATAQLQHATTFIPGPIRAKKWLEDSRTDHYRVRRRHGCWVRIPKRLGARTAAEIAQAVEIAGSHNGDHAPQVGKGFRLGWRYWRRRRGGPTRDRN